MRCDLRFLLRYPLEASRESALALLANSAGLGPGEAPGEYWFRRGLGHYLLARFDDAARALAIALSHDARLAEAHHLRGVCLQLIGLEAASRDPGFPESVAPEARLLFEKARACFERCIALNPGDEETRQLRAGVCLLLGVEVPVED